MAAPTGTDFVVCEPTLDRNSWFSQHPKLKEMQTWGFKDDVQIQTSLMVYLDLCEAKNWWHVTIHACPELSMAYMTGKPIKKAEIQTVLPITTQTNLSMERLQEYLEHIPFPPRKMSSEDERNQKVITLAIVDTDSTIVYYRIANGLLSPEIETEAQKQDKKNKGRKRTKKGEECVEKIAGVDVKDKTDPFREEEL